MKILIVDDDTDITESVRLGFGLQWREVELLSATNGDDGLRLLEEQRPDLVLLDVGLPRRDGYEILRELRGFTDIPVIMLTARDDVADKVKGLELGADDYITKPFDHLELLARVRAVLRRLDLKAPKSRVPSFRSGPLEIDFDAQEARLEGEHVALTPTEYRLLEHLARNAGWVVPHATLLSRVWGREYTAELDYLRVYVRRLRDKLGDDPARPRYIRTERGVGYRFIAPREPA
ncbi:MAG: response regulator transcription factor [Chloroflexota bacterium]